MLEKASFIYDHPLLAELKEQVPQEGMAMLDIGIQMVVARFSQPSVVELLRLIDGTKRLMAVPDSVPAQGQGAGWGKSMTNRSENFLPFLTTLQASLMKEYTASSMRKRF
jgi:hypothetical protein